MPPAVSIIVNNYNYGSYLAAAIDSALQQTYSQTEVVVVDDGSTDDSRDVLARYGDRIIPILKTNGGQASAFNTGFAASHGELVVFLDADDVLLPDLVARVAEVFRENPDAAKVQYRMEVIDESGAPTGLIKPFAHLPLRSGDLRRQELRFPDDMTWLPTSGNAFPARVLRQILPMPEDVYGPIGADWYLTHLTPLFGPVRTLNDVGAYYRVHASNNYERSTSQIDLEHVRATILFSYHTHRFIKHFADRLRLEYGPKGGAEILSVSFVANRMASLRLEPDRHPLQADTRSRLFKLGVIASFRRFDVPMPMRVLFALWFACMAAAPKVVVRRLARLFYFPEARRPMNRLFRRWHRSAGAANP